MSDSEVWQTVLLTLLAIPFALWFSSWVHPLAPKLNNADVAPAQYWKQCEADERWRRFDEAERSVQAFKRERLAQAAMDQKRRAALARLQGRLTGYQRAWVDP